MAQPNDVKQILELGGGAGHSNLEGMQRKKDGSKLKDKKKRPGMYSQTILNPTKFSHSQFPIFV